MKRRTFLRGLGGAAVALPILSSVPSLFAQPSEPIKRLVIFFQPNGVNMSDFFPANDRGALTDASFVGRGVEPLASFRSKLLVPRGIHMSPRGFGLDGIAGCDHRKGMSCKLTAVGLSDDSRNYALGHSVDFEAARRINPGGVDPLVLQVGRRIDPASGGATDFVSYSAANTPYAGENNPWNVYRSLMGIIPGGEAEDRIVRRRQSVADLVREDLQTLRRMPMSSDDRTKIDAWLALVRDTETSMPGLCDAGTPGALGITGVDRYDGMSADQVGSDGEFREAGRMLMRLSVLSMVCDQNRVSTIQWSRGSGGPTFRWDGIDHEFTHHQLSHRTGRDDAAGADLPGIERMIGDIDRWYASRFAELLGWMDQFGEGDGTVLDHSAVMWINELSDGKAHHFNNLPIVIAGSAGGYLKQGEVVDCSRGGDYGAIEGAPHNALLTTLLNAVGAASEGFGDTSRGRTGEYSQIKA
ncbi:DUF1552 domain-containing protein [Sandaracinus amylolyticus]|uniref:DUF1552 domain-containing protein n=1 Tax=Sandaracinus amylolyticus TaxID=927083 RepID=UPI001F291C4B|nr:DUF1552 domain-containing protein [Sandaracinus amylolyticus]UJR78184.1 Hypothetical protein I5071_2110 [Sandaracinus amylolyticus]